MTQVARRAGADDLPSSSEDDVSDDPGYDPRTKDHKAQSQAERKRRAKMMDLPYFLEMIDQKHRYGSSLRKYHKAWTKDDKTNQNFFYWLDYGDGKQVDLEECPREKLEREQVRYLSRQERLYYLVEVNAQGLLEWAKNGELVWTRDSLFRDSEVGIVPVDSDVPSWHPATSAPEKEDSDSDSDEDSSAGKKIKELSSAAFLKVLMSDPSARSRKWIFVADTSFRLYIGYKQSGAFQHSSFLHGSRILSAGQIKVKKGQIRQLSPLSGHYRPPVSSFRAFVHSLQEAGADLSRVSTTQSYAVLLGLNTYKNAQTKSKAAGKTFAHQIDKIVRPEKAKAQEEAAQDHSASAKIERQRLAEEKSESHKSSTTRKLTSKIKRIRGRDAEI